jgi:hypothetical protein
MPKKPSRTKKPLPRHAANSLRDLYEHAKLRGRSSGADEIASAYMTKLREEGWPLHSISEPLGLSVEAIRRRIIKGASRWALDHPRLPAVPKVATPERTVRRGRTYREITPEERERLLELYPLARQTRGYTPLDAPERAASLELWKLVDTMLRDQVKVTTIAELLGVTQGTVWMGIRRHGHRSTPPSQRPYRGILLPIMMQSQNLTCKRGHENWRTTVRYTRTGEHISRYCSTCNSMGKEGRARWDQEHRNEEKDTAA